MNTKPTEIQHFFHFLLKKFELLKNHGYFSSLSACHALQESREFSPTIVRDEKICYFCTILGYVRKNAK